LMDREPHARAMGYHQQDLRPRMPVQIRCGAEVPLNEPL
jgi:hypothetical protein